MLTTPNVNNNALATGTLASTANTADQVICTYTVPANKTFFLSLFEANVRLTAFATTATSFGACSLAQNGIKLSTFTVLAGAGVLSAPVYAEFPEPLPFQAGDVLTLVCTPSAATAFTWEGNLMGYLK